MSAQVVRRFAFPAFAWLVGSLVGWTAIRTAVAADPPADSADTSEVRKRIEAFRRRPPAETAPAKEAAKDGEPAPDKDTKKAAEEAAEKKAPPIRKDASGEPITFSKHIAPIFWKNCASCHRPGEIGPFSLLTFDDAAKRADFIAEVTKKRRMPPWKAEPKFGSFHEERRLTDTEINLIAGWAESGAPEGAKSDLPKLPKFSDGWQLGEPDLVLEMKESFEVPAEGPDIYRCFVIPIPLEKDTYVSAVEFRPGNRTVVHHAILFLDSLKEARKKDSQDPEPGYPSFGGPEISPTGGLGGWAPGTVPRGLADGIATYVKKGSDLVLQLHYHPSGKVEEDKSTIGIHFAKAVKGKLAKIVTGIAVVQPDLKIPAGEERAEFDAESEPLPAKVEVLAISPHMHNLGREMKVTATNPDGGDEVPLIWIKDWDFNWQGQYHFKAPIELPKGSVIKVHAAYDNSPNNPKNPNSPPQAVEWGLQSTDEMLLCSLQVVAEKPSDLKLIAALPHHELGAGLGGGVPGQAAVARKASTTKKSTSPLGDAAALAPERATRTKKADPFGEDGVAIPEEAKKYLLKYDTDKDGKLTRKEVNKMPSAMQGYFVRQVLHKGGS